MDNCVMAQRILSESSMFYTSWVRIIDMFKTLKFYIQMNLKRFIASTNKGGGELSYCVIMTND